MDFDFSRPGQPPPSPRPLQTPLDPGAFHRPPLRFHNLTLNGARGARAEAAAENFKAPAAVREKPIPPPLSAPSSGLRLCPRPGARGPTPQVRPAHRGDPGAPASPRAPSARIRAARAGWARRARAQRDRGCYFQPGVGGRWREGKFKKIKKKENEKEAKEKKQERRGLKKNIFLIAGSSAPSGRKLQLRSHFQLRGARVGATSWSPRAESWRGGRGCSPAVPSGRSAPTLRSPPSPNKQMHPCAGRGFASPELCPVL